MFSKSCEYGIKATLYIATNSLVGKRVSLHEIAEDIDSPKAFTAKILQHLSKNGIITSTKGPSGGFEIDLGDMLSIKLNKIVQAFDGDDIYKGCGLGLSECNDSKPCPVHSRFKDIRENLRKMLETTSILELTNGLNEGLTFLKH
ncbi:MAG: Rrf2 family transcriptional regulator [Bacteroidia bacterium]|nr:Rrf2 family transcriptional regulator [Bacteroidia bacterium]MCO5254835.1 Rrf2 family transcriptional regulator [Bacteroidota bacterium]